ncbi:hypothetical protein J6590_045009 [Homalodisca vitripennis]|nr:hypothetical protein J6590_045009 [Homalodisca vitripennis]
MSFEEWRGEMELGPISNLKLGSECNPLHILMTVCGTATSGPPIRKWLEVKIALLAESANVRECERERCCEREVRTHFPLHIPYQPLLNTACLRIFRPLPAALLVDARAGAHSPLQAKLSEISLVKLILSGYDRAENVDNMGLIGEGTGEELNYLDEIEENQEHNIGNILAVPNLSDQEHNINNILAVPDLSESPRLPATPSGPSEQRDCHWEKEIDPFRKRNAPVNPERAAFYYDPEIDYSADKSN